MGSSPLTLGVLAICAPLALGGHQAPVERPVHARVSLISTTPGFPWDGSEVTIGLRFVIDDGYRIAWKNPGLSGSAPVVTWSVPKSVEVGALEWPVPSRIVTNGTVSYGYTRGVIFPLTMRLRSAAASQQGGLLMMTGKVEYTVCSDACAHESATVGLGLSPGAPPNTRTAGAPAVDEAVSQVPKAMPSRWASAAHVVNGELILEVATGSPESAATFFPAQRGVVDDLALQRLETTPKGFVLHTRTSPDSTAAPTVLEGVIVIPNRGAFEVNSKIK